MNRSNLLLNSTGRRQKRGILARLIHRRRIAHYWGQTNRKGSVLLVVIGLLLLLMLIGFTFFTFSSQEHVSSEYYADSQKMFGDPGLDADIYFDFALRQLILGPDESEAQSALYPGRHSLVPTMIGMLNANTDGVPTPLDRQPYNGVGVHVISDTSGQPYVDQDHDGAGDPTNLPLLDINHSQLGYTRAQFLNPGAPPFPQFPTIDAGYTYPDVNSVFLAYVGNDPQFGRQIVIPSFHRPQYLRTSGNTIGNWPRNGTTTTKVMRPHLNHVVRGTGTARFLDTTVTVGLQTILPFPLDRDANGNGTSNEQGVFTDSTQPTNLDYDTDNDGDGIYEGVWVDLDFPMQTLPDGRNIIPLFSFTVIDADGLVNLNLSGNLAGFFDLNKTTLQNSLVSRSNLGLSPTEINPIWSLSANPESTTYLNPANASGNPTNELQTYRATYGRSNTDDTQYVFSRLEMANMEMFSLLWGRGKYSVTMSGANEVFTLKDLYEGRWGESTSLFNAIQTSNLSAYPRPGVPNVDDDADQAEGLNTEVDTNLGLGLRTMFHPLDYDGSGSSLAYDANGRIVQLSPQPSSGAMLRWPQYTGYQSGSLYQNLTVSPYGATLVPGPNTQGLLDASYRDADEQITDRRYKNTLGARDQIFGPEEIAGLHLSDGDFKSALGTARLRQLLPFNFENNLQAQTIRKRFTTESYDRREHGFRYSASRPWEFNADADLGGADGIKEFPPIAANASADAFDQLQPIRPELRSALAMELPTPAGMLINPVAWPQWRLNINRFLTSASPGTKAGPFSTTNALRYRHLMPHPADPGATAIPLAPSTTPPNAGMLSPDQEYWARRDRQLMARDIYVLLYLLGGGDDSVDYSSVQNVDPDGSGGPQQRPLYTDWQLQEMAQFAVNYVDALDRDDVITMFEYDKNLADGWNLDDNAFTSNDPNLVALADRDVVFGVEAQQLAINEVLLVRSNRVRDSTDSFYINHQATQFDDSVQDRYYSYIELQNVSPFNVLVDKQSWQIAVENPAIPNQDRWRLTLNDAGTQIQSGAAYAIGSRTYVAGGADDVSAGTPQPSYLMVDPTWNTSSMSVNLQRIAPAGTLNLDLVENTGNGRYVLTDNGGAAVAKGAFMDYGTDPTFPLTAQIVLRRRLHLSRIAGAPEADNPWVEVDRFQLELKEANPDPTADPALNAPQIYSFRLRDPNTAMLGANTHTVDTQPKLAKIRSLERRQPLARFDWSLHNAAIVSNTIGQANEQSSAVPLEQVVWQPRFDRDFSSVMELLSIPLYGPAEVTDKLAFNRRLVSDVIQGTRFDARTAQARFLRPDFPDNVASSGQGLIGLSTYQQRGTQFIASVNPLPNYVVNPNNISYDAVSPLGVDATDQQRLDNRWYRILELLEVPSRANMQLAKQPNTSFTRYPAKLNLNGLRHKENLFALLDDPNVFDLNMNDTFESRDWWYQFMASRDGRDPTTGMIVPGTGASRPFRDLSTVDGSLVSAANTYGVPPIEQTLLRRLIQDGEDLNWNGTIEAGEDANIPPLGTLTAVPSNGPRGIFEARTVNDIAVPPAPPAAPGAVQKVDYQTRHRLLSKVANNSTKRSNVFIVWISVGFFDAYQPDPTNTPNVVQIGAETTDQPRRRGFFIVDRTLLEDAYDPVSQTFDFKKFVQYRNVVE